MVKVRYSEGVAIHTDPESCAGLCREAVREALIGGRTGEVLSGESNLVRGADAVVACRRQQARVCHRKDLGHPASSLDPEHVRTSLVREPGGLRSALGKPSPGRNEEVRPIDSVRWAAHETWGLESPRRSNEGRCVQKRGQCLAGRESKRVWRSLNGHAGESRKQPRRTWSQLLGVSRRKGCPERSGIRRV